MKYILVLITLSLIACGGTKEIEEYDARVKYCRMNGATYETETNGYGQVSVICIKDGHKFKSKIYEGLEK